MTKLFSYSERNRRMRLLCSGIVCLCAVIYTAVSAQIPNAYSEWLHQGVFYILTTEEGAALPEAATVEEFPLLVRLHKDFFDFSQAKPQGEDLRFSMEGKPLKYEVESWNAIEGEASVWVRIPVIKGNTRHEIRLHWGKADATRESNGQEVFNESNGYLSVWHLHDDVKDAIGTVRSVNSGTITAAGIVGQGRHFGGRQGIFCGDDIVNYPTNSNASTTEAWLRAEKPNSTLVAWGNEQAQGKIVMQLRSPPHIEMDCYFSDANVRGTSSLPMMEWNHVVHTYDKGEARVYVNGMLDGVSKKAGAPLNIRRPARMWIGGWYNNYSFAGDLDEVRISKTARSQHWIKLEYENQKPLQTLVGLMVQPGDDFDVSPKEVIVEEGKDISVKVRAGGAQKLYWNLKKNGLQTVLAVDRLSLQFNSGRVAGDQLAQLEVNAIYPNGIKTKVVPITIKEAIAEPRFSLKTQAEWDGRQEIEITPVIANLDGMKKCGADELKYKWSLSGLAVIKEETPQKLILKRAQNSGLLVVTLGLSNGGSEVVRAITIKVNEPKQDAWIQRLPPDDEKPEDNQFYARDNNDRGTLFCNGSLVTDAEAVFLRVFADEKIFSNEVQKLAADKRYALSVKLKPGFVKYRIEFGTITGKKENVLHTATNIVCGDAYIINGQSNALATDTSETAPPYTNEWIRTFGSTSSDPQRARLRLWGNATWKSRDEKLQLGYWGMELAKTLVNNQKIPICILNGAVGGTRIDQHQRNPNDPEDVSTIYGRILWRTRQAKLSHGIRAILWHQGENDQGADGPSGRFGWETYRDLFVDLAAGWKRDYPNIQQYYVFQIWPKACAMGVNGSDNMLREIQRKLPNDFSHLGIMSTLGIKPPGGCHYPLSGWAEFSRLIYPLIEQDIYGVAPTASITPPNLVSASFSELAKDTVILQFDQPVKWDNSLCGEFYLDGEKGNVASGSANGNRLILKLNTRTEAHKITYLDSKSWNQDRLLWGENGIAALTFCDVPITTPKSSAGEGLRLMLDVYDRPVGKRIAAKVSLRDATNELVGFEGMSKNEAADRNDHAIFRLQKGRTYLVQVEHDGNTVKLYYTAGTNEADRLSIYLGGIPPVRALPEPMKYTSLTHKSLPPKDETKLKEACAGFFKAPTNQQANWKFPAGLEKLLRENDRAVRQAVWETYKTVPIHQSLRQDFDAGQVRFEKHLSPYTSKTVGARPSKGWALFIAMHGGGGAPKELNDSQWRVMQIYYRDHPEVGGYIYVALRAPNDTWNGFYAGYVYPLIQNLLRQFLLFGDVDPDKVFIMGYSHGGYGAFAIGPKMPDRFAAIHASAAAPADGAVPITLRNTVFSCMLGSRDTMYGRYDRIQEFMKEINTLRGERTDIYPVTVQIIADHPHAGLPDRDKIAEMYAAVRNPVPQDLVWKLTDNVITDHFWLKVKAPVAGMKIEATCRDNRITVNTATNTASASILLDSRLVDFKKPITLQLNQALISCKLQPSLKVLCETIQQRGDPELAFTAEMPLPPSSNTKHQIR